MLHQILKALGFDPVARSEREDRVEAAYRAVVRQARSPAFFTDNAVPDTLDGRYDLIVLHLFLLHHRLRAESREAGRWLQALLERFVDDMDRNLRELGVSDLRVGTRVKAMAFGLNGRFRAYGDAIGEEAALVIALDNNLYGTVLDPHPEVLRRMAAYVRAAADMLADTNPVQLLAGEFAFPPPPTPSPPGGPY